MYVSLQLILPEQGLEPEPLEETVLESNGQVD